MYCKNTMDDILRLSKNLKKLVIYDKSNLKSKHFRIRC